MKRSVVVCTRNRAYAIAGCLDSIAVAVAHASPVEAEIVVVDNGSEDDTSAVITQWAKACAFPVRLLYEARKGLAVARNCGVRAAQKLRDYYMTSETRLQLWQSLLADDKERVRGFTRIKPLEEGVALSLFRASWMPHRWM